MPYSLLETINTPEELRALERKDLPRLAEELRAYLLEAVSQTGGHLASNLGVVELTVALHYLYDFKVDRLVWDDDLPRRVLLGQDRLRLADGQS